MANETSGEFFDPAGNLMRLVSTSPDSFRILVTRKLAAGWSYAPTSPAVTPLADESTLAVPPPLPPPPYDEVIVNVGDGFVGDAEALADSIARAVTRGYVE